MYSWACGAVKLGIGIAVCGAVSCGPSQSPATSASSSCDPFLSVLFTPSSPQLGRYEVCTSTEPLLALAEPGWRIDAVDPIDALGTAGSFNRARVARLFGGRRATVARGWLRREQGLESVTLMSPHPNKDLTRLEAGTLVIRHFVPD